MRWMVIAGVLVAAAWAMPARAEDEKAPDAATLRTERDAALKENAKLKADLAHIKDAYNQLSARSSKRLSTTHSMADSLSAAREMILMLQTEKQELTAAHAKLRAIHKNDVDALHEALRRETAQKVKLTVALRTSGEDRDTMLVDLTERLAAARAKLAKVEAALTDLAKTLR